MSLALCLALPFGHALSDNVAQIVANHKGDRLATFGHTSHSNIVTVWSNPLSREGNDPQTVRDSSHSLVGHVARLTCAAFHHHPATHTELFLSSSADGLIRVWDVRRYESLRTTHTLRQLHPACCSHVHSMHSSPDGERLVCTGFAGGFDVYDFRTMQVRESHGKHFGRVTDVHVGAGDSDFQPSGPFANSFVTAGVDGLVCLWDSRLQHANTITCPSGDFCERLLLSHDTGLLLCMMHWGSVHLYDLRTNKHRGTFRPAALHGATPKEFSPALASHRARASVAHVALDSSERFLFTVSRRDEGACVGVYRFPECLLESDSAQGPSRPHPSPARPKGLVPGFLNRLIGSPSIASVLSSPRATPLPRYSTPHSMVAGDTPKRPGVDVPLAVFAARDWAERPGTVQGMVFHARTNQLIMASPFPRSAPEFQSRIQFWDAAPVLASLAKQSPGHPVPHAPSAAAAECGVIAPSHTLSSSPLSRRTSSRTMRTWGEWLVEAIGGGEAGDGDEAGSERVIECATAVCIVPAFLPTFASAHELAAEARTEQAGTPSRGRSRVFSQQTSHETSAMPHVVVGDRTGAVALVDSRTGRLLLDAKVHEAPVTCIHHFLDDCLWQEQQGAGLEADLLGDGQAQGKSGAHFVVSGASDGTLVCMALSEAALDGSPPTRLALEGHAAHVTCVASTPDGFLWEDLPFARAAARKQSNRSRLFCSGSTDRTVKVWDPSVGKASLLSFDAHPDEVLCVAFVEPAMVASLCADGSVCLWGLDSGVLERQYSGERARALGQRFFRTDASKADSSLGALYTAPQGGPVLVAKNSPTSVFLSYETSGAVRASSTSCVAIDVINLCDGLNRMVLHWASLPTFPKGWEHQELVVFEPDREHCFWYSQPPMDADDLAAEDEGEESARAIDGELQGDEQPGCFNLNVINNYVDSPSVQREGGIPSPLDLGGREPWPEALAQQTVPPLRLEESVGGAGGEEEEEEEEDDDDEGEGEGKQPEDDLVSATPSESVANSEPPSTPQRRVQQVRVFLHKQDEDPALRCSWRQLMEGMAYILPWEVSSELDDAMQADLGVSRPSLQHTVPGCMGVYFHPLSRAARSAKCAARRGSWAAPMQLCLSEQLSAVVLVGLSAFAAVVSQVPQFARVGGMLKTFVQSVGTHRDQIKSPCLAVLGSLRFHPSSAIQAAAERLMNSELESLGDALDTAHFTDTVEDLVRKLECSANELHKDAICVCLCRVMSELKTVGPIQRQLGAIAARLMHMLSSPNLVAESSALNALAANLPTLVPFLSQKAPWQIFSKLFVSEEGQAKMVLSMSNLLTIGLHFGDQLLVFLADKLRNGIVDQSPDAVTLVGMAVDGLASQCPQLVASRVQYFLNSIVSAHSKRQSPQISTHVVEFCETLCAHLPNADFSLIGQVLVCTTNTVGQVSLLKLRTMEFVRWQCHQAPIHSIKFARATSRHFVTLSCDDQSVRLWSLAEGRGKPLAISADVAFQQPILEGKRVFNDDGRVLLHLQFHVVTPSAPPSSPAAAALSSKVQELLEPSAGASEVPAPLPAPAPSSSPSPSPPQSPSQSSPTKRSWFGGGKGDSPPASANDGGLGSSGVPQGGKKGGSSLQGVAMVTVRYNDKHLLQVQFKPT